MNKKKLSRGKRWLRKQSLRKRSLVTAITLGFMLLGLGTISWSAYGIWTQNHYSNELSVLPKKASTDKKVEEEVDVKSDTSNPLPPADKTLYPVYPVEGDNIGTITIPALNRKVALMQGTEENELKKGAGHFIQSVLPGEKDNCVISAHRETAFSQLDKLKVGDLVIVQTSAGTFTYEVSGTRIVHKDDKTVIVPTDDAVLTMTTCYPFDYIGNAPDRYIVSAVLVSSK